MLMAATDTRTPDLELVLTPAPAFPLAGPVDTPALGLELPDLEELLFAIGDREDHATLDERARLARARRALERELARILAQ